MKMHGRLDPRLSRVTWNVSQPAARLLKLWRVGIGRIKCDLSLGRGYLA